ncbi:hypothetical protein HYFRA_00003517 [Hymenoscyphus fraxineus]|uniref:Uncharacterized protein n=1 Tax=Hymenoscyphus fraxineus TaxID=746836 RepID=A0A9N9KWC0_9HELO|nr:hypothetical protein HYFRA_00003517 [Hymenoscyphus fraxineus]
MSSKLSSNRCREVNNDAIRDATYDSASGLDWQVTCSFLSIGHIRRNDAEADTAKEKKKSKRKEAPIAMCCERAKAS